MELASEISKGIQLLRQAIEGKAYEGSEGKDIIQFGEIVNQTISKLNKIDAIRIIFDGTRKFIVTISLRNTRALQPQHLAVG